MASGWPIGTEAQGKWKLAGPVKVLTSEMFQLSGCRLLRHFFGHFLEPGDDLVRTLTLDDTVPHCGTAADVLDDIDEIRQPLDSHCRSPLGDAQQISHAIMPQVRLWKTGPELAVFNCDLLQSFIA